MTPSEMREEKSWAASLKKEKKRLEELSFLEQIELAEEARDFAARMVKLEAKDFQQDDEEIGDLASELGNAFKIIDRTIWFLREFDIEGIKLPPEIDKESMLLFNEAKAFVDRMEYGLPSVVIAEEITK